MKTCLPIFFATLASPALASETVRQLDSHEHGVGELNIAIEGGSVVMEFHAPGADIVGFEYKPKSAEDRSAIDAAVAVLARPLELFVVPAAAECSIVRASAQLEQDDDHDDHEDHASHDDHDEHEEHANHDHGHDDEHAEHGHEEHASEEAHSEFHAEYALACSNIDGMNEIKFAYFDSFENARELEVQIVSANGAQAFEVTRDDPVLDLRSLF